VVEFILQIIANPWNYDFDPIAGWQFRRHPPQIRLPFIMPA
jgi:hypothetical protein